MTLRFQEIFLTEPYFVFEGPIETRIKFNTDISLDENRCIFKLLYSPKGVQAMAQFQKQYLQIADIANIPIILNAPTYRANERYIAMCGFKTPEGISKINQDAVRFTQAIRDQFPEFNEGVFVAGPIGPKYDAYSFDPKTAMTVDEAQAFHSAQALALSAAKADLILVATMTNKNEAIGAAKAAAKADLTYGVGLVATQNGTLLDGTRIEDLIDEIDASVSPRPFFYYFSCTHVSVAEQALARDCPQYQRILAIHANGCNKPLERLRKLKYAVSDAPSQFAKEMVSFCQKHYIKIMGGCCGTDHRHLQAICAILGEDYQK